MKVKNKMSLAAYDNFCQEQLPEKIPDMDHKDVRRKLGDCLYDFSDPQHVVQRMGVHGPDSVSRDIGGVYALLSTHFYYFGDQAIEIPTEYRRIIKQGQAHKSTSNDPIKHDFVLWLETLNYRLNTLHGKPHFVIDFKKKGKGGCECGDLKNKGINERRLTLASKC